MFGLATVKPCAKGRESDKMAEVKESLMFIALGLKSLNVLRFIFFLFILSIISKPLQDDLRS
jgi:hypothetical protein